MKSALANFQTLPLKDAARQLLAKLGYQSDKFLVGAGSKPQDFIDDFATGHPFDQAKALLSEWKSADLLFQLTDQELSRESSLFTDASVQRGLPLNPSGALHGDALLLELIGEIQPLGVDDEGFLLGLAWVKTVDERRFAKEEIEMVDPVEGVLEGVVGVNGEVGGYDRELRSIADLGPKKVSDASPRVIVTKAGIVGQIGCLIHRGVKKEPETGQGWISPQVSAPAFEPNASRKGSRI